MTQASALTHAALISQELAGEHSNSERADIVARAALAYTKNPAGLLPFLTGLIIAAYAQLDAALDTTNRVPLTNRQLRKAMQRKGCR